MYSGCDDHRREEVHGAESFAELDAGRKLVLWGMRVWVSGLHQDWPADRTSETLQDGFAMAYAAAAIEPLGDMMSILAGGSCRQIAINCPRCPAVTEDEHLLLDLLALCQHRMTDRGGADRLDSFAGLAGAVMVPAAIRLFEGQAVRLAAILAQFGVSVPVRQAEDGSLKSDAGTVRRYIHPAPANLQ
ncbi:MAG: hypothetical protein KJ904_12010 [Alphaproteobacteria bacterium]|nr:hypothetical protein [Alphaproteobacteria bacterium]MBU0797073.1 hypothetical protein [Alphaproteobacteria bacterium]MBU0887880.1 hypothetical protein [Alphaproteobacteria bacterium]MBU1814897.1 hypothetical protein [Alphaproteobacteria bacterium]